MTDNVTHLVPSLLKIYLENKSFWLKGNNAKKGRRGAKRNFVFYVLKNISNFDLSFQINEKYNNGSNPNLKTTILFRLYVMYITVEIPKFLVTLLSLAKLFLLTSY